MRPASWLVLVMVAFVGGCEAAQAREAVVVWR